MRKTARCVSYATGITAAATTDVACYSRRRLGNELRDRTIYERSDNIILFSECPSSVLGNAEPNNEWLHEGRGWLFLKC